MENERYHYQTLCNEEKTAYRLIYNGIQSHALSIPIPNHLPLSRVQEIYMLVLIDEPMFYFINQAIISATEPGKRYVLLPEYLYSDHEIEMINREIQTILQKINAKACMYISNPFRLEKFLHDSVVKSVAYDYEALKTTDCFNAHSIVGVFLDKRAVCEGISKAFKLLCNQYGMKCIVAIGKADASQQFGEQMNHSWNIVKVGNESYHVDVTWDNLRDSGIDAISYDYFNTTTEDILKDHYPSKEYPLCTDTRLNYYYATNSFVSTYKELVDLISQRIKTGKVMFKVKRGSKDFPTLEEMQKKMDHAIQQVMLLRGNGYIVYSSINDTQWTGKIFFEPTNLKKTFRSYSSGKSQT